MEVVGDMSRVLVLRTNQVKLREEMDKLAVEVATGFVRDAGQHLKGDLTGLQAIDRSLSRLEAYSVNTTEATFLTGSMQVTLGEIQSRSETISQTLISAELTPKSKEIKAKFLFLRETAQHFWMAWLLRLASPPQEQLMRAPLLPMDH